MYGRVYPSIVEAVSQEHAPPGELSFMRKIFFKASEKINLNLV